MIRFPSPIISSVKKTFFRSRSFLRWTVPGLFSLIFNCSWCRQRESNSDQWSTNPERWPLDLHHSPIRSRSWWIVNFIFEFMFLKKAENSKSCEKIIFWKIEAFPALRFEFLNEGKNLGVKWKKVINDIENFFVMFATVLRLEQLKRIRLLIFYRNSRHAF